MRTINSISILAVLAIAGLSSCSKDTATTPLVADNSLAQPPPTDLAGTTALADTKVAATALPQVVPDYVATNYPDATVSKSEVENNGNYEVMLDQGTELVFEQAGTFLGVDDDTEDDFGDKVVDPAALPQTVIDYVAANYADIQISSASLENNGNYEVLLSDGTDLVFDGKGVFLGIGVDGNEGNDNGNDVDDDNRNGDQNEDGTVIDAASLPQLAKDYLSTTYPDATIVESRSMADGGFEVEMSTGTEVVFDANGSFLKTDDQDNDDGDGDQNGGADNGNENDDGDNQNGNQHEDGTVIDTATLPQLVKEYLSTTYPTATIVESRSMADGGFEVEMSTGTEVVFDANGSFVKTEDGSSEDGD